jgi:hypothetical protein
MLPIVATEDETVFEDFLGDFGPDDLIVLFKSYMDESFDDDLLCVAGYLFSSPKARELDHDWKRMLYKFRLPYFRMSACNANKPPFDHLTEEQCDQVAREAIGLIRKYASLGFAVTVDQVGFYKWEEGTHGPIRTPYEAAVWNCLFPVSIWCDDNAKDAKISYFFETGFRDEGLTRRLAKRIFSHPTLKHDFRHKSDTFIDKSECRPLQAADLLSWQWWKNTNRTAEGRKPRGDFQALTADGLPHWNVHLDEDSFRRLRAHVLERDPNAIEVASLMARYDFSFENNRPPKSRR